MVGLLSSGGGRKDSSISWHFLRESLVSSTFLGSNNRRHGGFFFSFIPSFAYPCGLSLQAPFQNNPLFQGGESSNLTVQDGGWHWEEGRCSSGRLTGPLFSGSPLSVPCASDPRALLSFQQKKHHLSFIARLLLLDFVLLILSSTFKYPHIRWHLPSYVIASPVLPFSGFMCLLFPGFHLRTVKGEGRQTPVFHPLRESLRFFSFPNQVQDLLCFLCWSYKST